MNNLKNYNPVQGRNIHTVRVTFMDGEYTGHIAFEVGGNCRGSDFLNDDFLEEDMQEEIEQYVENDCDFRFHDVEDGYFTATLADPDGNLLYVDGDSADMSKRIVRIEIAGVRPSEEAKKAWEREQSD